MPVDQSDWGGLDQQDDDTDHSQDLHCKQRPQQDNTETSSINNENK